MTRLNLKAYAKINIGLEIIGARPDGYHDINTVFYRVGLADDLTLEPSDGFGISCSADLGIDPENNLAMRAARLFFDKFNPPARGVHITLTKNIPAGAGLGGGSSDAACVLTGLAGLFDRRIKPNDLASIAIALGSDVPYFLREGAAVAQGRGEVLDYFDYKPQYDVLLINPGINIPTKWAYESLRRQLNQRTGADLKKILIDSANDPSILKHNVFNDFERVVFSHYPAIGEIKDSLYGFGAVFALMSGSGSSVYGFFDDPAKARRAREPFSRYFTYLMRRSDK